MVTSRTRKVSNFSSFNRDVVDAVLWGGSTLKLKLTLQIRDILLQVMPCRTRSGLAKPIKANTLRGYLLGGVRGCSVSNHSRGSYQELIDLMMLY